MTNDPWANHRAEVIELARAEPRLDALVRIHLWNRGLGREGGQIDAGDVISDLAEGEFTAAVGLFNRLAHAFCPVAAAAFRREPIEAARAKIRAEFPGLSDFVYERAFYDAMHAMR